MDKGGCSVGRKKEPKGGCKVGKKKKFNVVKKEEPKQKKIKFNVIKKLFVEAKDNVDGKNKIDLQKRKRIVDKILKMGRAQILKKQEKGKAIRAATKKKIKFNVIKKTPPKKVIVSEIQKYTDLTKTEANQLSAVELFGMLPVALRKTILTPDITGQLVGVAPPLSEANAQILTTLLDNASGTNGFKDYVYQWSFYEGGNFTDAARKYFEKKADQIEKNSYFFEIRDLLQEPKMESIMRSTLKKHGNLTGSSYRSELKNYFNAKGEFDEDSLYNNDYEEYYPEDRYDLIYEDGDYNMSNRTRSTTNSLVKDVIEKELKPEMKKFKAFEKEMKKLIK